VNLKKFELDWLLGKPAADNKKPIVKLDVGLVRKDSRDERTAIELFMAGVRAGWKVYSRTGRQERRRR
jgi:hypothetical protein